MGALLISRDLQEVLAALRAPAAPAVLATLVRVKGSSYRRAGARMLLRPDAEPIGGVSAGCLEVDLQARVAEVLKLGEPQVARFQMGHELDLIWGTGMGCGDAAEVLLEPVTPGAPAPWVSACHDLLAHRRPGALATVFAARGGADLPVGTRVVLDAEGLSLGPDHPLRAELESALREVLATEVAAGLTFACGAGEVDLLLEPLPPPFALWVYGAGENARPLARLARELGWFLGIVDHRPALATPERFPEADRLVVGHPPACLEGLPFDGRSAALVISHIYDKDRAAVAALLEQPLAYVGLQGNRARSARIIAEIEATHGPLSDEQRRRLHVPAGLDLGGGSPEVIALAMVAEVQATLAGHGGGRLKDRCGGIHQRST